MSGKRRKSCATELEEAILDWMAHRHPHLADQLETAEVVQLEHSGAGRFAYLSAEDLDWEGPCDGPVIYSSQLEANAGSVLWLSKGNPQCLEIYAFGSHFPEVLDDFALSD